MLLIADEIRTGLARSGGWFACMTGRADVVRARGATEAIELVQTGTTEPDAVAARAVASRCHERGVVPTCGTFANVIRLLPPLVIDAELLADGLDLLDASARALDG